jgi:hypothetical protein
MVLGLAERDREPEKRQGPFPLRPTPLLLLPLQPPPPHYHPLQIFKEILHKHWRAQQSRSCCWSVYMCVELRARVLRIRQYHLHLTIGKLDNNTYYRWEINIVFIIAADLSEHLIKY